MVEEAIKTVMFSMGSLLTGNLDGQHFYVWQAILCKLGHL